MTFDSAADSQVRRQCGLPFSAHLFLFPSDFSDWNNKAHIRAPNTRLQARRTYPTSNLLAHHGRCELAYLFGGQPERISFIAASAFSQETKFYDLLGVSPSASDSELKKAVSTQTPCRLDGAMLSNLIWPCAVS